MSMTTGQVKNYFRRLIREDRSQIEDKLFRFRAAYRDCADVHAPYDVNRNMSIAELVAHYEQLLQQNREATDWIESAHVDLKTLIEATGDDDGNG